ncbi:MAG: hypothetical protein PHE11_02860 [Candidatus Omnitrophica bacterium]|nr:hypothetical protein [Candidatus Omnitrophota bacterium]MDD5526329.1 hypothetical protein [Candidatus Omnitrophota bacterium]
MLHRYGNIEYVMRLPLHRAAKLIAKAAEEKRREYYFQMWLMRFAMMDNDSFVPFDEFYESTKAPQVDKRPKDEIMRELLGRGE